MDSNRCQQGIKEVPPFETCPELLQFEVQFLAFEDALSSCSMVIEFLESRTAAWGFGKDPQILWGMGIDHPPIIRCRTFAIGRIGFGSFVGTSPFLAISILAVSGIIHLVSLSTDGDALGANGCH